MKESKIDVYVLLEFVCGHIVLGSAFFSFFLLVLDMNLVLASISL